jgi:hypothetical protein
VLQPRSTLRALSLSNDQSRLGNMPGQCGPGHMSARANGGWFACAVLDRRCEEGTTTPPVHDSVHHEFTMTGSSSTARVFHSKAPPNDVPGRFRLGAAVYLLAPIPLVNEWWCSISRAKSRNNLVCAVAIGGNKSLQCLHDETKGLPARRPRLCRNTLISLSAANHCLLYIYLAIIVHVHS